MDLAAVTDRTAVEAALTEALGQRITTIERLQQALRQGGGRGRRGAKVLRSIVSYIGDHRPESILELRLLRLIRRAGLPVPISQFTVRRAGEIVARLDFAYPEFLLAIEADGYLYHGGRSAWRRDLARRNELTELGWRVIHVTWNDLSDRPQTVVRRIRDVIGTPTLPSFRA